jgi:hypothetical protein
MAFLRKGCPPTVGEPDRRMPERAKMRQSKNEGLGREGRSRRGLFFHREAV